VFFTAVFVKRLLVDYLADAVDVAVIIKEKVRLAIKLT